MSVRRLSKWETLVAAWRLRLPKFALGKPADSVTAFLYFFIFPFIWTLLACCDGGIKYIVPELSFNFLPSWLCLSSPFLWPPVPHLSAAFVPLQTFFRCHWRRGQSSLSRHVTLSCKTNLKIYIFRELYTIPGTTYSAVNFRGAKVSEVTFEKMCIRNGILCYVGNVMFFFSAGHLFSHPLPPSLYFPLFCAVPRVW